jgi:hypothetical protein
VFYDGDVSEEAPQNSRAGVGAGGAAALALGNPKLLVLVLGEYLAGAVIAVMLGTGWTLDVTPTPGRAASCTPCWSARPGRCTGTRTGR